MIATKTKISYQCSNCKANHAKSVGRCHFCGEWNCVIEVSVAPKVYKIPRESAKRKQQVQEMKGVETDLDRFFAKVREIELQGECRCQNCDISVKNSLKSDEIWIWRGCISHVIKKSKFDSVKCEINNYTLSCLLCHGQWESSWANAIKMDVFKIAKAKFNTFRHLITESMSHLPDELLN